MVVDMETEWIAEPLSGSATAKVTRDRLGLQHEAFRQNLSHEVTLAYNLFICQPELGSPYFV